MTKQFLRRLNAPADWADFTDKVNDADFDCPEAILKEICDLDGWSVFEVNNEHELKRTVAALMLTPPVKEAIHVLLIPETALTKIKVSVTSSAGKVLDKKVSNAHRDVKSYSYKKLKALAVTLASCDPQTYYFADAMNFVGELLGTDQAARSDIFGTRSNKTMDTFGRVMGELWSKGYLNITLPA